MTKRKRFTVQRPYIDRTWAIFDNDLKRWYKDKAYCTIYFKTREAAQKQANRLNRGA